MSRANWGERGRREGEEKEEEEENAEPSEVPPLSLLLLFFCNQLHFLLLLMPTVFFFFFKFRPSIGFRESRPKYRVSDRNPKFRPKSNEIWNEKFQRGVSFQFMNRTEKFRQFRPKRNEFRNYTACLMHNETEKMVSLGKMITVI